MKQILAIMCGLVVLFMGGCGIVALAAGPLALLPFGIAFLNLAILGALFGWKLQWKPAFYILGIADILIALGCVWATLQLTSPADQSFLPLMWAISAIIALKGILSFAYARSKETAST